MRSLARVAPLCPRPRLPCLQAQQRYRAKRKAQFEALQMQVETLSAELDASKASDTLGAGTRA